MIGIVIVSHSAQLAGGVLELAREMAGPDVPIAVAGGFDESLGPGLGTSMTLILQAIGQVYSDEGVLVLMDMGSAVLNSEMALEMLPCKRRSRVLLCSAPVVEGAIAAATGARLGRTLSEIAREADNALAVKRSHLEGSVDLSARSTEGKGEKKEQPCGDGEGLQIRIHLANGHGLHARPAARLIQTAAGFQAKVFVWNITKNRGPVSTRSLNDLMMLGALKGHELMINASGRQAREVLDAIEELAKRNFGDDETGERRICENMEASTGMDGDPQCLFDGHLKGAAVSPGIAIGTVQFLSVPAVPSIPFEKTSDPDAEWDMLVKAWEKTERQIEKQRAHVVRLDDTGTKELFDAHLLLVRDDSLRMAARGQIFDCGHNSARAWHLTVEEAAARYGSLGDEYLAARAKDVSEVGRQVLVNLLGAGAAPVVMEKGGILVGEEISLSDIASMDPKMVLGICTGRNGGLSAHGIILARNLGIPAVMGLGERVLGVEPNTTVIVDGDAGLVFIDPPPGLADDYRKRIADLQVSLEKARRESSLPALMTDGRHIDVHANIGSPAEAEAAIASGAEGVGLYRTEFLFLSRKTAPDEEEQYEMYLKAGRVLDGRPFVIRTLDVGGDKMLPYLRVEEEQNPFLGLRGLRLSLKHRGLFLTQLRAIVRTASELAVKIMFPMVSTLKELREAVMLLSEASAAVSAEGLTVPEKIETGIMIEVPAAAMLAWQFAPLVDFFSIGSNDLTQYVLASERGNPAVQDLYSSLHPAVLRLVHHVVEAAHCYGKWVSVCGEMAGDAGAASLLVGLGVDKLSMNCRAILPVKQAIRKLDQYQAEELARIAMGLESAEDVRAMLNKGTPVEGPRS